MLTFSRVAVRLNSNGLEEQFDVPSSGGFLLSAAEQFLKHELTKNFKARHRLLHGVLH